MCKQTEKEFLLYNYLVIPFFFSGVYGDCGGAWVDEE